MAQKFHYTYPSPVGPITICTLDDKITQVSTHRDIAGSTERETSVISKAGEQLAEYFAGTRKTFDLPLDAEGTEFQKRVWNALCDIPYGETRSYKDVAEAVDNPKGSRAIGMANNRNPIMIIVPCHRVIGANGKMTGYAGGIDKKETLLELESRNK